MIDLLTGLLQGDADNITLSRAQALDLVQCLQRPTEGNANPKSDREQQLVEDLKQMNAHARLGDYAGRVFLDLKSLSNNRSLSGRADEVVMDLDGVDLHPKAHRNVRAAFGSAVDNLARIQHMDFDTAEFAVRAYSSRNKACHSESMQCKTAEAWSALGVQIQTDLTELTEILPAAELEKSDKWRKVIEYFRDRFLLQDSSGIWRKRVDHPIVEATKDRIKSENARSRTMHMLIDLFENGRFGFPSKTSTNAERERARSLPDPPDFDKFPAPSFLSDNSKRVAVAPPEEEPPAKKIRLAEGLIGHPAINEPEMHQVREHVLELLGLVIEYAGQYPRLCKGTPEAFIGDMESALSGSRKTQGGEGQGIEEGIICSLDGAVDVDTEMVTVTEAVSIGDSKMDSQALGVDSKAPAAESEASTENLVDIPSQSGSSRSGSSSESESDDPDTTTATAATELAAGVQDLGP